MSSCKPSWASNLLSLNDTLVAYIRRRFQKDTRFRLRLCFIALLDIINNAKLLTEYSAGLHEFDRMKSSEVSDFRVHMKQMAKDIAAERDRKVRDNLRVHLHWSKATSLPDGFIENSI